MSVPIALALVLATVAALLALLLLLWRKPYLLVRLEDLRLRRGMGLKLRSASMAGHRWIWVEREAARADAPTLVLVHGFTGSKSNWYVLARELGRRYRLLIPDLPGWGESERIEGQDYGFAAQAARLAAFIERVDHRAGSELLLLGHSMGGGIVALTAARYPQLIDRVGMFNAAGVRFADNVFGQAVLDGHNPFAVHDAESLRTYIDTVFLSEAHKPRIPRWAVPLVTAWRRRQAGFEQLVLDRIGRGEESFLPFEEADRIAQPTLLLNSVEDAVIDASALELYAARIPQAIKVMLGGSGHMSIVEKPQDCARAIDELIEHGVPR